MVSFERLFRDLQRRSVVWFLDADMDARAIVGRVAAWAQKFIDTHYEPAAFDVYPYKSEQMLAFTLLLNDLADDPWGWIPVPTPQLQRLLIVFTRELFVYACRYMYPSAAVFYRVFQRARMSQLELLVGHAFRLRKHPCISLALSKAKAFLDTLATVLRLPVSGFGVDFEVPLHMTQPLFQSPFPTWFGDEPSRPLPPFDLSLAFCSASYRIWLSDEGELGFTSPGRQIAFRSPDSEVPHSLLSTRVHVHVAPVGGDRGLCATYPAQWYAPFHDAYAARPPPLRGTTRQTRCRGTSSQHRGPSAGGRRLSRVDSAWALTTLA